MKKIVMFFVIFFAFVLIYFGNIAVYAAGDNVDITFENQNLYKSVVKQLGDNYTYTKNDNTKTISITTIEIEKIKDLELDGNDVTDISGIEQFTALERLNLNNNRIEDISDLMSLSNLNYLDLSHNCVTSINSINNLSELEYLDLYDNVVRDLSSLNGMTNLEYLNLGDNNEVRVSEIVNLESLETLTNLKEFNFSRNNTPTIVNYLSNMTSLETLNLQGNSIDNITNLQNLTSLKELYLNSNSITDITSLSNLSNLEILYLNNNQITSLEALFSNNELALSNLKKLHIYSLKQLNKNSAELTNLKNLSKNKEIELGYEIIYDSVEPHTDSEGIQYITYDDFGARCDGIYDDMIAIKDAHRYANSKGYEVRATQGKTYHIFNYYSGTAQINTNTDWQEATFIIHDEDIEKCSGRFDNIFTVTSNYSGITTINNPEVELNKSTKKIIGIEDTLSTLNSKGYQKYMVVAENANKKISLRYGTSSKDNQIDCFEIDSEGNLLNDIQWDFEELTKITIYPISDKKLSIKNGNFITNSLNGIHDVPYGRNYDKPLYFQRGFFFWAASNVDLINIHHTLSENRLSGSYYGFFCFRFCSDITMKDSSFFAREFGDNKSRSTYDLKFEQSVNFYIENISSNGMYDSNRWGVMASAYCKDFVFQSVELNRIDAHQVIYNLTVKDSHLGYRGFTLTGQGTLVVENTLIEAEYFINLRSDYGSSWDGDIYIRNCTHRHQSQYGFKFINFSIGLDNGELHDFGYEVHQPNIYIENYTIDCINNRNVKSYPIIANYTDHNFEKALDDYWPQNMYINGYKIINNDNSAPYITFIHTNSDKIDNNYIITNTKLQVGEEDFTSKFNSGETFITDEDVQLKIIQNISADNTITIYKDNEIIVNSQEVINEFIYKFTENGNYKIKINSTDTHFGKTGEKIYEFGIQKKVDEGVMEIVEILDNKYNDLTNNITILSNTSVVTNFDVLSGEKICYFELKGETNFNDIEATLKLENDMVNKNDVIALYYYKNSKWEIFGYYEIIEDGKFTFETEKLGKYVIVNKSVENKNASPIITDTSKNSDKNFRDKKDRDGIYTSSEDIVVSHWWGAGYANNLEFINVNFKTNETGIMNFNNKENNEICNFYFENCTFDGLSFKFANKGHYVFNNCTFINSPEGTVECIGENINVYLYNSTLRDNNPNKEEFNANASSERAWKYSAIGFRRNNCSAHVLNTTIENYMTNNSVYGATNSTGNRLYFEYSKIRNVEGQAIGFYCEMKGRIDNNEFYNIGELRGKNGYAIKYSEEFGGSGVGGNAVFCNKRTREMRIYKNNIKNVMENAIEGHYYCVNDNVIESTGYRYEEGFTTVSTEAIWGGSWQVKNNIIKDVHGRGIMVNRWDNHETEVSGNTVIKSGRNVEEDYEGIRVNIADSGNANVLVTNNTIQGFVNKYRVLNANSEYMMENVVIEDTGDGKLMGNVYSSLRGLNFSSDRQQKLDFKNSNFQEADENGITDWNSKNLTGMIEQKEENGVKYGSFESKDQYGRIFQKFDLPKETCIVCLKITLRSSLDTVNVFVTSENDEGVRYESGDGGVYSEYKIPITGLDNSEFKTVYMCFKAKDHSTIGLYVKQANQTVDVQSIEGYYMIDDCRSNVDEEPNNQENNQEHNQENNQENNQKSENKENNSDGNIANSNNENIINNKNKSENAVIEANKNNPKTGDMGIKIWVLLSVVSLVGIIVVLCNKKINKHKK